MTQSVYIIGGAGTGKSTFTGQLLDRMDAVPGPLEPLQALRNAKALVTLRGHRLGSSGLYLGVLREHFPGSDGLDRASSPVGEAWLNEGNLPDYIIGEGATLATRRFLNALAETTDLLLLHLTVDPFIADLRFLLRGSSQATSFVTNTVTRSANLANYFRHGVKVVDVDTESTPEWESALEAAEKHLKVTR